MKTIILIFSTLAVLSCGNDNEDKSIITENATLYYYYDAGFGTSKCDYVIETLRGNIYTPKLYSKLSKIKNSNRNGSNSKTEIVISYRLTEDSMYRCYHKKGFLTDSIAIVEVILAKKR